MTSNDLVTLRDMLDPSEAYILKARLQAEGIPVFLLGDQHVQMNWLHSIALGGVRLQVRLRDEASARHVLAAIDRGEYQLSEQDGKAE